jgi:hypothetical protein
VPDDAVVIRFVDEPSGMLGQDLHTEAELQLLPSQTASLVSEAGRLGYLRATSEDLRQRARVDTVNRAGLSEHGWNEAANALGAGRVGYLRYQRESASSYSLAVLDSTANRLVIRVVIL